MPFELIDDAGNTYDSSQDWRNKVGFLPNPTEFLYLCEASLNMAGRAYFMRQSNVAGYGKQPRYLLPGSVTLKEDKLPAIEFTRYVNNSPKTFTPKDIIYVWAMDPQVEIGPALSCPASVSAHACGVLYNVDEFAEAFFERGAIKSMLLTVTGNPPPGTMDKLREWWRRVVGGIRNAWGAEVINADTVNPVVVGEGMKELENVTLTAEKKEDVATAFEIPFSILFSSAANYATAVQDKRNWYDDSIVPECNWLAQKLTEQMFEPLGLRLNFLPETLDIYQEDEASRAAALSQLVPILSDPMAEIAMQILGYEVDRDQLAALKKIWDAKTKASEAALERLNNPPPPAPVVAPAQPVQAEQPVSDDEQPPVTPARTLTALQIKDLDLWRQVAVRSFRKGKGAVIDFECKALPAEIADPIRERLKAAETEDDIMQAFEVGEVQTDPMLIMAAAINRAVDALAV